MDFLSCWLVWVFLLSVSFVLYLLPLQADTLLYLRLCIAVWGLRNHTCNRLIFDHSSDIIRQEFRQTAGLEMAQGRLCGWSLDSHSSLVCDSLLFLCPLHSLCILLFALRMPARLPRDPDVVSCPESVNSASLLVEQSSYRSPQQNSSISQICSYNTKQHWLHNSPNRRRECVLLLHTLALFLIFFFPHCVCFHLTGWWETGEFPWLDSFGQRDGFLSGE